MGQVTPGGCLAQAPGPHLAAVALLLYLALGAAAAQGPGGPQGAMEQDYDYEVIEVEEGWEDVVEEEEVDNAETWDYPEYDYVDISRDSDGDGLRDHIDDPDDDNDGIPDLQDDDDDGDGITDREDSDWFAHDEM